MDTPPQKAFNVRFQMIRGRNLLVQHHNAYEIDDVGVSIWELCDGHHTAEQIVEALTREYDVDYDAALADCRDFIQDLRAKGLLE
jgi:hypothetical protein